MAEQTEDDGRMEGARSGFLEVGTDGSGQVVINHPKLIQDRAGGHIVFSPTEARNLARLLLKKATEANQEWEQAERL